MTTAQDTRSVLDTARAQLSDVRFHLGLLALAAEDDLIVGHIVSAAANALLAIRRIDQALDDLGEEAAGG